MKTTTASDRTFSDSDVARLIGAILISEEPGGSTTPRMVCETAGLDVATVHAIMRACVCEGSDELRKRFNLAGVNIRCRIIHGKTRWTFFVDEVDRKVPAEAPNGAR